MWIRSSCVCTRGSPSSERISCNTSVIVRLAIACEIKLRCLRRWNFVYSKHLCNNWFRRFLAFDKSMDTLDTCAYVPSNIRGENLPIA